MGQDNQPTEAGLEAPSLRCASQAVKQWAAPLWRALLALGEALPPEGEGGAAGPPPWRISWCRAPAGPAAPLPSVEGAKREGIAVWLDVGPAIERRACRPLARALGLKPGATLLCPGLGADHLAATLLRVCALPQVACVVVDARDAEHQVARALERVAHGPGQRPRAHRAPVTVLAHFCPPGAPGGADLPIKWPKLDHLQGMA